MRRFRIEDDGVTLSFSPQAPTPPDPNYRRRDLNVVPVVTATLGLPVSSWVALSGVFTLPGGAWTVPVSISPLGVPSMADPSLPGTFKQGMNNYVAPTLGLFSTSGNMYTVVMGGISFGYFANGVFQNRCGAAVHQPGDHDPDRSPGPLHAVSDGRRVSRDPLDGVESRQSPAVRSGSAVLSVDPLPMFDNGVLQLERLGTAPVVVGYIAGGIQSTVPNTAQRSDSAASPHIFKVTLIPARAMRRAHLLRWRPRPRRST